MFPDLSAEKLIAELFRPPSDEGRPGSAHFVMPDGISGKRGLGRSVYVFDGSSQTSSLIV
ncbi:hypothetical protein MA20_07700 [Bradyrhizobium japonicum]|uniref:Uncharacterized protein n=1 Tax=Bradyrhizobium japonicum TaxID=375 RepID=A0A0A3Y1E1_BRAJP|nr:hypothetical protein MA20_07700 [Bradyrhizobium japonicum]